MIYLTSKLNAASLSGFVRLSAAEEIWVLPGCCMLCDAWDTASWERRYGAGGSIRTELDQLLVTLGASTSRIHYWNYFEETSPALLHQISRADVLVIPGGQMELGLQRFYASGMDGVLASYQGTVLANSAGALLLFEQYMVSPNQHYPEFRMETGLGVLSWDAFLEVHYDPRCAEQRDSIERILKLRGVPVYALAEDGLLVADGKRIVTQHHCCIFTPEHSGRQSFQTVLN